MTHPTHPHQTLGPSAFEQQWPPPPTPPAPPAPPSGKDAASESKTKSRLTIASVLTLIAFGLIWLSAPPSGAGQQTCGTSPVTYADIRSSISSGSSAARRANTASFAGAPIEAWRGTVKDVKNKFFGGYYVQVNLDGDSFSEVHIDVFSDKAVNLSPRSAICFDGTIRFVQVVEGQAFIQLDNPRIWSPE